MLTTYGGLCLNPCERGFAIGTYSITTGSGESSMRETYVPNENWYRKIDGVVHAIIGRPHAKDEYGTFLFPGASWWENGKMVRQFRGHSLYFFETNWTKGFYKDGN